MYNDIILTINSNDADIEFLADRLQRLREELLETDVEDVRQVRRGDLPKGAKSLESIDWGALLVTIAVVGGGVSAFLSLVGSWTQRNQGSEISMVLPNGAKGMPGVIVPRKTVVELRRLIDDVVAGL